MSSSESRETTVVQTELDSDTYERFRRVAEQEGRSLKATLRSAVTEYVRRHLQYDEDDPLFDVTPGTGDRETDARSTDRYLADAIENDGD